MKVKLMGIQRIDFVAENTGEAVQGSKLHVVADYEENDNMMTGRRCAAIFTRLDVSKLKIGANIDLVYDQVLGSTKARLVAINPVG